MLIAFLLLLVGFVFGWFTFPAMQRVAEKVLARWLGSGFFAALMLMPAIAFAQTPPSAASASNIGEVLLHLLDALGPTVILLGLAYFIAHQSGVIGWLQAHRDAKDASNGERLAANAGLIVDRLAAAGAAKLVALLQSNPTATVSQLLPQVAAAAKSSLSVDGVLSIVENLGIADNGIASHLEGEIASQLGAAQQAAATNAGKAAAAPIATQPLTAVAANLPK